MLLTLQVYNKKGSDVYNMALKLRAHITKLFEVILDSALQVIIVILKVLIYTKRPVFEIAVLSSPKSMFPEIAW